MKKKYVQALTFCLLLSFLVNDTKAQVVDSCLPPPDVNNPVLFLAPSAVKQYVINYRQKHKRKKQTHTKSIYLTRDNFCFMSNFFKDNPDYSGLRIHFSAYREIRADGQVHPKQITLFFTPVINNLSRYDVFQPYYDNNPGKRDCPVFPAPQGIEEGQSVNHGELCPSHCDDETDEWGEDPLPPSPGPQSTSSRTGSSKTNSKKRKIEILKPADAARFKEYYRKRFCFLWNRKHTKYITLNKENIIFINGFFSDPTYREFDGVRIFFVSYDQKILDNQKHDKQISLYIAPAYGTGTTTEPDFCAFIKYFNSRSDAQNAGLKTPGQVEICRANCPEE
jgi:hypothetical protein